MILSGWSVVLETLRLSLWMSKAPLDTNLILHCVSELHYGVSFQYIIMRQIKELMSFINTKACINLATLKGQKNLLPSVG